MENLSINFRLDPSLKMEKNLLRQKDAKLLIDVDGELKINIDHSTFFLEPSLTLLELGVDLKRWRIRDSRATKKFFTMEHDEREDPILAFIKKVKKSGISSQYGKNLNTKVQYLLRFYWKQWIGT